MYQAIAKIFVHILSTILAVSVSIELRCSNNISWTFHWVCIFVGVDGLAVVGKNDKVDPEKLKRDREELEKRQREGETFF